MSSTDQAEGVAIDLTDGDTSAVVDLRDGAPSLAPGQPAAGEQPAAGSAQDPASGPADQDTVGGAGDSPAADAPADAQPADGEWFASQDDEPEDPLAGIELTAALESLLMIAGEAMTAADLAVATGMPEPEVQSELEALAAQYLEQGRGFELRSVSGAWRFYSAAHCAPVVHRWVTDGRQSRLSQAALETLAVVAYQQPVSRAKVGAIRGVNVDGVMRTLHARGLVAETAADPHTGATLYGTTDYFLERMGLTDLTELPPIGDLLPDPSDVTDHVDGEALDLP